jgi:hypothetical protein
MADVVVAGKRVTIRDNWTGRAAFRAGAALSALRPALDDSEALRDMADSAYDSYLVLCKTGIESWEFEGEPSDITSYEALSPAVQMELFAHVLVAAASGYAREQVEAETEKKD